MQGDLQQPVWLELLEECAREQQTAQEEQQRRQQEMQQRQQELQQRRLEARHRVDAQPSGYPLRSRKRSQPLSTASDLDCLLRCLEAIVLCNG